MDPYVVHYFLEWNPDQDLGQVTLKYTNGKEAIFKVTSLSEMAGWAALVQQRPLFVAADGTLHTYPVD